jgi:putative nucleotidyltransferase with HDIG domain
MHHSADYLTALLESAQEMYSGEPVTQLEHALQCADLAQSAKADEELIVAALLHDIGHIAYPETAAGDLHHERRGAGLLRGLGYGDRVCELVAGHVDAKRYLTAVSPEYYERLSEASRTSLEAQGGPMAQEQVEKFASDPLMLDKLRLHSWDEQAKAPGAPVSPLAGYRELLFRHGGPLPSDLTHGSRW